MIANGNTATVGFGLYGVNGMAFNWIFWIIAWLLMLATFLAAAIAVIYGARQLDRDGETTEHHHK